MKDIHLSLAWPPTISSYYNHTKRGVYISKGGREFRESVVHACIEQGVYNLRLDIPLEYDIILYPPDKRVRDLDNHIKAVQDALSTNRDGKHANLWIDDRQVHRFTPYRGVVSPGGFCLIRIKEFAGMIMPNIGDKVWDFIE